MIVNPKLNQYVKQIQSKAEIAYKEQQIPRYKPPSYTDSIVQETMMRCGIGVYLDVDTNNPDEMYILAIAKLTDYYITNYDKQKYYNELFQSTTTNIISLFEKQINNENYNGVLFYVTIVEGVLQIYSSTSIDELITQYKSGYVLHNGLPILYI
jgi:hypothetical protein